MRQAHPPVATSRRPLLTLLAGLVGSVLALPAQALEFRSVSVPVAILYDGPSLQAKRLFLVRQFTPLDVQGSTNAWVKVRGPDSTLAWIERRNLADKRMVMITGLRVSVRQAPDEMAPVVFEAEKLVALELLEDAGNGWLRVRHRDGASGYLKTSQVWGAS